MYLSICTTVRHRKAKNVKYAEGIRTSVIKVKHEWIVLRPLRCVGAHEKQKETKQFGLIVSCVMEIRWGIKIINFSFTPTIITVIKSWNNLWFWRLLQFTEADWRKKQQNDKSSKRVTKKKKNLSAFLPEMLCYAGRHELSPSLSFAFSVRRTDLLHH